jgi:hypothetical protein
MTEINVLLQDDKGQYLHLTGKVHGLTALKLVAMLHQAVLPPAGKDVPIAICGAVPRECGVKVEGPYTPTDNGQVPSRVTGEVRFES